MAGKVKTLYSNREKTEALFPRTKTSAISNEDGVGLDALIENVIYSGIDNPEAAAAPIDADSLGGIPADEYATENFVAVKIAEAQMGGGSGNVDLSGYATKDDVSNAVRAIDFPVDSVNGKTGAVQLSASDVGAFSTGHATTAINDLSDGVWSISANAANAPSASACIVYHKTWDTNFKVQEAVDAEGKWYHRCRMSGSWSGWSRADLASLTYSSVGAAPSGHGLGADAVDKSWSDVDSLVTNGWYRFQNINVTLNNVGVVSALLKVSFFGGMYGEQVLYAINTASGSAEIPVLRRTRGYGSWQPWECVNPPMDYGVEYRTIERFGGKVVYCKAVSTGAYPGAGGFKIVSTGTTAMTRVIRHCGFVNTGTYVVSLPIFDETNGAETGYHIVTSERNIYLVSKGNASMYTSSCVYMWYTKD